MASNKCSLKDRVIIFTSLAKMLSSSVTVPRCCTILMETGGKEINQRALQILHDESEAGKTLSEIFREHEKLFGLGIWRQVAAGERSATLTEVLNRIALQAESNQALSSKIRSAIMYPVVVLLLAFVASAYLFHTVLPQFIVAFEEFDAELPAFTVAVLGVYQFVAGHAILMIPAIIGLIFLTHYLIKGPLRLKWHKSLATFPLSKTISRALNYSLAYTIISDMSETGATIEECLRVGADACRNTYIREDLLGALTLISRNGLELGVALRQCESMDMIDKALIRVGEDTGDRIAMLRTLSATKKQEASDMADGMVQLLQPVCIALVGVMIGTIVIALYYPTITLSSAIG